MNNGVYEKLARCLDDLPAGYPRTESGVELRILRRLFTPEEAGLALHLTLVPEEPRVVARRAGIPVAEAAGMLAGMLQKGLIYAIGGPDGNLQYQLMQFVVGFWEAQVNHLTPELVQDFEEYLPHFMNFTTWRKAPQMRTVPVGVSLDARTTVLPHERAEELVQAQELFAVANCICRQEHQILGNTCGKPMESCLAMGRAAEHVLRTNRGRAITRDEALLLLRQAAETGLVLQPGNARQALFICMCCGCCCGVLRTLKLAPRPARLVSSPFLAVFAAGSCTGCGICQTRCQMAAIGLKGKQAVLDPERCIGCGLCVNTCPAGALRLERKPSEAQAKVPGTITGTYIRLARSRGKLGLGSILSMQLHSKLDRFRTRKEKPEPPPRA